MTEYYIAGIAQRVLKEMKDCQASEDELDDFLHSEVYNAIYSREGRSEALRVKGQVREYIEEHDMLEENNTVGKIHEYCPYCEAEVLIPSDRASKCPDCGAPILPCNACSEEETFKCDWSRDKGCFKFPKEKDGVQS